MAGINPADLRLLVQTTLENLPDQNYDVGWDHLDYLACRIFNKEQTQINGGESITRYLQLDPGGNARYRLPFDTDSPTINTQMKRVNVPWTRIGTHWAWDITELLQNRGNPHGIIDTVKARKLNEVWGLYNLIEERFWKTPTNANDVLYPYGIPYYLNAIDADSTTGGFVGQTIRFQDATTSTTAANLDASTNTKWKNYADIYTNVDNDFLKTFRKLIVKTGFKVPYGIKDPTDGRVASKRICCDADTAVELMTLLDARDDNHRPEDLMGQVKINMKLSEEGVLTINRIPVIPVTELDGVTDPVTDTAYAPIYVIDFSKLVPVVMQDYWMKEVPPDNQPSSHTVYMGFMDGMHQILCTNRRQLGGIIHKAIVS